MSRVSVLFLCTGNSARSQMAEAFLRDLGGGRFAAFSAGLEPRGIHPLTRKVMSEIGLDLRGPTSKSVKEYLGRRAFHHVVTVCDRTERNCPTTFPGRPLRHYWSLLDPAAAPGSVADRLAAFRDVREAVHAQVVAFVRDAVVGHAGGPSHSAR